MEFKIELFDHIFKISGLVFKGKSYNSFLLNNYFKGTIYEQASIIKQEKIKNRPHPLSMDFNHAVFDYLFDNREGDFKEEIEKARQFISERMYGNQFSLTQTLIEYNPKGIQDKVIQDVGLDTQRPIGGDIVGPHEIVINSKDSSVYNSILGTSDLVKIDKIYSWLLGKTPEIMRMNNKPNISTISIAGFEANFKGVSFDCIHSLKIPSFSLGVIAHEI